MGGHDAKRAAHHHSHLGAREHAKRIRTRWRVPHRENSAKQVQHIHRGDSGGPPCPSQRWE